MNNNLIYLKSDKGMSDPIRYQSPIALSFDDIIPLTKHCLDKRGKNRGAEYIPETHLFEVKDNIFLYIHDKKYRLMEYHFHAPGEHTINGVSYKAELHYVFYEVNDNDTIRDLFNVCNGENPNNDNIVIVSRVITNNNDDNTVLERIQLKLPMIYFEYDGVIVKSGDNVDNETDLTVPIRWIVGKCPIQLYIKEVESVAKDSHPIQPLDNRIVLFTC